MPSTRRSFLATAAATPFALGVAAADGALGVQWRQSVPGERLRDSTRVGDTTVLLTGRPDESGTLRAVADDGSHRWVRPVPDLPAVEAVTGAADGGVLLAGRAETGDDHVVVARLTPDRSLAWRHRVGVGYHDDELRVRPLGDGVVLVSNELGTHAVSTRFQHVAADGTVRWDDTRDGLAGLVTGTIDGDLAVGGYAFESEFHGWLDRIAPDGGTVWARRWPTYLDVAGAGPAGGVTVATLPDDEGGPGWRYRYLSTDGVTERTWTHNFDGDAPMPVATARLADGGAMTVADVDESGRVFFLRTGPEGSPDSATVVPYESATVPRAVYPLAEGAIVAGHAQSATDPGAWVARLAPGAPQQPTDAGTPTGTDTRTRTTRTATDTEVTPYPPPPTTTSETTTGDSGPGFGPLAALAGLGTATLAKLRDDEKGAD